MRKCMISLLFLFLCLSQYTVVVAREDREPYITTATFNFNEVDKKGDIKPDYGSTRVGESNATYIQSSNIKLEILDVENYNNSWKIRYKLTGYQYSKVYKGQYSGSRSTVIRINHTPLQADDYYTNDYYQRHTYNGVEHTTYVSKKADRPMLLEISSDLYAHSRNASSSETHEARSYQRVYWNINNPPVLSNEIDRNYINGKDSHSITIKGKVWDLEQDSIDIVAQVNGGPTLSKSMQITTPEAGSHGSYDYSFTFNQSEFPYDFNGNITVTAKDHFGDLSITNIPIYIDRTHPTVNTPDTYLLKAGSTIKVNTSEVSSIYLLKNNTDYALYSDVVAAENGGNGYYLATINNDTKDIPIPSGIHGSYRLFAVDRGKNVSQPYENIIQIDNKKPNLKKIVVEGNTLKFIYDEAIMNTTSADDVIVPIENHVSSSVCVIAHEDRVDYAFIFDDYEQDMKYTDHFIFSAFSNSMFTNTNGIPDVVGKTATSTNAFHHVGKYTLEYQARDTPIEDSENTFSNYRKWGNKNLVELLVHRRPIAKLDVDAYIQNDNWNIRSMNGSGYDLDHMDMANKGIVQEQYQWKKSTDNGFQTGIMPSGLPTKEDNKPINYIIKYKVKDMEGAWSEPVSYILNFNLLFEAKLKSEKGQPLHRVSTDQNLITYEAITTCPYDVKLQLALYDESGTSPVPGTYTKTITLQQNINGTRTGLVTHWRDLPYYIPKHTPEDWYTFKATAISSDGQSITKEWKVYLINNTPPTVDIASTIPSVIYESDRVKSMIQVDDADLDTLTVTVHLLKDGSLLSSEGYPKAYTISPDSSNRYESLEVVLLDPIPLGDYELKVLVDDSNGGTATDETTLTPLPLSITGSVSHHPRWNENRIKYNRSKSGKDDEPRAINTYWSGERFILGALTTVIDPASRLTVSRVWVRIIEPSRLSPQPYETNLSIQSAGRWSGELWDKTMIYRWGRPSPENLTFRFTVVYSNGAVKEHDVTITIDDLEAYYKYHRKW